MLLRAIGDRWLALVRPSLSFAGRTALAAGATGALGLDWYLAARAGSLEQSGRAVRVAWLVWLIGLSGICEDRHDSRVFVAPTSVPERLAHRLAVASVLSAVVGAAVLATAGLLTQLPPSRGLLAEMTALLSLTFGLSSLARTLAPPGLTAVAASLGLLAALASELVLPARLRVWPHPESSQFTSARAPWLAVGACLTVAGFVVGSAETRGRRE